MAGKNGHNVRCTLALAAAVTVAAYAAAPTTLLAQPAANPAAQQQAQTPLPVPPGIEPETLSVRQGDSLKQAQMSLEQVLASLELPAVLTREEPPQPADAEPPLQAQQLYAQARAALLERRNFDAITHLEAAQKIDPDNATILAELGQIYTSSGNVVQGARYFERAVDADPNQLESVFMVGRLAAERGRWSDAIAWLAHGLTIEDETADPAYIPLMHFYLGSALEKQGYDAAAIQQFEAYLNMPDWRARSTRLAGQLNLLQRLKPVKMLALGDSHHRLGRPKLALDAYNNAVALNVGSEPAVIARLVYTDLLLGEGKRAQQRIAEGVATQPSSRQMVELIEYLHTAAPQAGPALLDLVTQIYEKGGRPSSLAIALASLLGDQRGRELLQEHLRAKPQDREVLVALIERELGDAEEGVGEAVTSAADVIDAQPDSLDVALEALTNAAGGEANVLEAIDKLPADQSARPAVRSMRGITLARMGRINDAEQALRDAVTAQGDTGPRVQLARVLIVQKKFDEARTLLEKEVDGVKPANPEAVSLYVRVLVHDNEYEKAVALLDQLIEREPGQIDLALTKADLQLKQLKATKDAARTLLDALNRHPQDERLYEALLDLYDENGMNTEWQQLMRRMLSEIPDSRFGKLERAKLFSTNNPAQAENLLKSILVENPQDHEALREWLALMVRTNRKEQATSLIEKKLREFPADESMLALAIVFYQTEPIRDQQRATDLKEQLLRLQPESLARTQALALLYLQSQRPEKAIGEVLAALENQQLDDPGELFEILGIALVNAKQAAKVDDQFTKALQRFPDHHDKLTLQWAAILGYAQEQQRAAEVLISHLDSGKSEEPAKVLDGIGDLLTALDRRAEFDDHAAKAMQKYPEHVADLTFTWAMHYDQAGEHDRSEQMLENMLKKHPDHALANNHLGYTWANTDRNLDQARDMIARAVKSEPDSAAFLDSMGWVLYKLGDFDGAIQWLQKSINADGGSHPVILDHLGDALYRAGRNDEARAVWEDASRKMTMLSIGNDPEMKQLSEKLPQKLRSLRNQQAPKPPVATSPGGDAAK